VILRSGVDLIEINRMAGLNPRIRARFLARVFTPAELDNCRNANASLSGRFAAKEAVAKALGTGIGPIRWQEIEICDGPQGEPVLQLHGAAHQLADQLGLDTWSVSISHTATHAVAMAVALGKNRQSKAGQR
jgi:holo-[acyl-carrier protein] synthase